MREADVRERLSYLLALPPDELVFHHLAALAAEAPDLLEEIEAALKAWPAPWSARMPGQPLQDWLREGVTRVVDSYDRILAPAELSEFGQALQAAYDQAQAAFGLDFSQPLVSVQVADGEGACEDRPHVAPHMTIAGCDGHYFVTVAPPTSDGAGWLLHGDPCEDREEITRALSGYAAFRVPPNLHELDERLEAGWWPVQVARQACVTLDPAAVIVALRRGDIRWQPETVEGFARLLGIDDHTFEAVGATAAQLWSVIEVQLERFEVMLVRGRGDDALRALPEPLAQHLWKATSARWMKAHDQAASRVLVELDEAAQRGAFPPKHG